MATFPLSHKISQASSVLTDQLFMEANYGDGVSQRAAIGINSISDTWNIQFNNISASDRDTLRSFFLSHGRVVSFDWTPPNGSVSKKFIFSTGLTETNYSELYSLQFQLKEVFE